MDRKKYEEELRKLEDCNWPIEVKRLKAAFLASNWNGSGIIGQGYVWSCLAVAIYGTNDDWEERSLREFMEELLPIFVKGYDFEQISGTTMARVQVYTTWDFQFPLDLFAQVFAPVGRWYRKMSGRPATVEKARKEFEKSYDLHFENLYARVEGRLHNSNGDSFPAVVDYLDQLKPFTRHVDKDKLKEVHGDVKRMALEKDLPSKDGDRYTLRPYQMAKELGTIRRFPIKGRALMKNTAMRCPVCKQMKNVDPARPWHVGKTVCCPDCKAIMTGMGIPHVTYKGPPPKEDYVAGPGTVMNNPEKFFERYGRMQPGLPSQQQFDHPAVNAMMQGLEADKLMQYGELEERVMAVGVDHAAPGSEVTAIVKVEKENDQKTAMNIFKAAQLSMEVWKHHIATALGIPAELIGIETSSVAAAEQHSRIAYGSCDEPRIKGHNPSEIIMDEITNADVTEALEKTKDLPVLSVSRTGGTPTFKYDSLWMDGVKIAGPGTAELKRHDKKTDDPHWMVSVPVMEITSNEPPSDDGVSLPMFGHFKKGDEAVLYSEDDAEMGRAVYTGKGRFVVKDDPMDIKIGKKFWGVYTCGSLNHNLDPTVVHGEVVWFCLVSDARDNKQTTDVALKLENGHIVKIHDAHKGKLFLTEEEAEKDRVKRMEDMERFLGRRNVPDE